MLLPEPCKNPVRTSLLLQAALIALTEIGPVVTAWRGPSMNYPTRRGFRAPVRPEPPVGRLCGCCYAGLRPHQLSSGVSAQRPRGKVPAPEAPAAGLQAAADSVSMFLLALGGNQNTAGRRCNRALRPSVQVRVALRSSHGRRDIEGIALKQ